MRPLPFPFLPDQPSDPALTRWPIANTGGVHCAIVLSISTVSLRRQGTLVLYLAGGVVEECLLWIFGAGRRIDRHIELFLAKMPQTAFTTSSVNFRSSDNSTIDDLCYAKVSDPRVGNRDRMFIGADGSLSFYSLHEDTTMNTNDSMALGSSFQMIFEDTVRISKSKKYSCNYMQFVPSKHMLIAIIDDVIMSYDVISLQLITQILDTKGVSKFNYHEESGILVCNIKKKVMVYTFSGAGFVSIIRLHCYHYYHFHNNNEKNHANRRLSPSPLQPYAHLFCFP